MADDAAQNEAAAVAETPAAKPQREKRRRPKRRPKQQPRYHVILWNDNDHTHVYVIHMLQSLFGYPTEKGYQMASEVHHRGRVIVLTTTLEHAELKRDQIHAFGKDPLVEVCKGSMWCTIEPDK